MANSSQVMMTETIIFGKTFLGLLSTEGDGMPLRLQAAKPGSIAQQQHAHLLYQRTFAAGMLTESLKESRSKSFAGLDISVKCSRHFLCVSVCHISSIIFVFRCSVRSGLWQ